MMATTQQQQFCVRWNSYQSNLQNAFPKLLTSEHFVDVTLACESEMIKCHKVVLSACSTYFEKLLVQNPCQHPIIFMKDMRFAEMQALVDFMYKGEVNVTQDELPSLLRSAEALQIRGLCGSDQLLSQHNLSNLQGGVTQQQQQQQQQANNNSNSNTSNTCSPTANGIHTDKKDSQSTGTATNGGGNSEQQLKKKTTTDGELVLENGRLDVVKREPIDVPDTVSIGNSNSTHSTTNSTYSNRGGVGAGGTGGDHEYNSELTPTHITKDELYDNDESYYDNDGDLMDTEYLDQELDEDPSQPGTSGGHGGGVGGMGVGGGSGTMMHNEKSPDFAIANVSCQYSSDGSPGGGIPGARRIRRSEAELRRAAECITRGQTFQTVSDQFNIPISTIRFYMARKGILPRRKRGRACSTPGSNMLPSSHNSSGNMSGGGGSSGGFHGSTGNTSPVGPPYHIVHYKLPTLGAKLK